MSNNAAMLETLREIASIDIGNFQEPIDGDSSAIYQNAKYDDKGRVFKGKEIPAFYGAIWYRNLKMAVDKAKAAHSEPPRNCDRFATWEAAISSFREETKNSKPLELWLGREIQAFAIWLYSPAKPETKG